MFIKMTLAGIDRDIREDQLDHYLAYGWERVVEDKTEESKVSLPQTVDGGKITVRAPKKKKATKPAETAPEAAIEDLGNANQQGD